MTCRELIEFLAEYVSGELPELERATFDEHLASAPGVWITSRATRRRFASASWPSRISTSQSPKRCLPSSSTPSSPPARNADSGGAGRYSLTVSSRSPAAYRITSTTSITSDMAFRTISVRTQTPKKSSAGI